MKLYITFFYNSFYLTIFLVLFTKYFFFYCFDRVDLFVTIYKSKLLVLPIRRGIVLDFEFNLGF